MELMFHSSSFLLPSIPPDNRPSLTYALVLLNQRLPRFAPLLWKHGTAFSSRIDRPLFLFIDWFSEKLRCVCACLFRAARLRLCADGGANRVYDEIPLFFPHEDASVVRSRFKPDVIKGDMDSVRTEVLDFYSNMGTEILDESEDQDTTDLDKCVRYVRDFAPNLDKSNLCILVAGALGGRFDHEMGNINVLCRYPTLRMILLSEDCLIYLLPKTHHHEILIQPSIEGPHCGLIPIGMPSGSTTTTGLQWDLTETEMKFGGLVSTSNIAKEEKITVRSETDLLWTISIKRP